VRIADGFDPGDAACAFEHTTEDGIYLKVETVGTRITSIATVPPAIVCTEKQPCSVVFAVVTKSCEGPVTRVQYADGFATKSSSVRHLFHRPYHHTAPPQECESLTQVSAYLTTARILGATRYFAATSDLK
jgi:hypothetical protein